MKLIDLLKPAIVFFILPAITSCDNELDLPKTAKEGIAVKTIESTAPFDISDRNDWILALGNYRYNHSIEENVLRGTIEGLTRKAWTNEWPISR